MENDPAPSVTVPLEEPFTAMVTPVSGWPSSEEVTFPAIAWDKTAFSVQKNRKTGNRCFMRVIFS
jgi:hypothetical protein